MASQLIEQPVASVLAREIPRYSYFEKETHSRKTIAKLYCNSTNAEENIFFFLSCRYGKHPSLLGIELLNEPSAALVPLDTLVSYYKQGYDIVRKYSSTAYVIICQRIGNADPMELYQANIGSHNLVVDLHYYNLFDPFFDHLSPSDNIEVIYKSRQTQLQALNAANGPLVFVGKPSDLSFLTLPWYGN